MRFKVDENLPAEAGAILRKSGWSADTVAEEGLTGTSDQSLFDRCKSEQRVLLTLDLDFANIQAYPPGTNCGIIVIRSKSQDKPTILALVRRVCVLLGGKSPEKQLWIVERDRVRYRQSYV